MSRLPGSDYQRDDTGWFSFPSNSTGSTMLRTKSYSPNEAPEPASNPSSTGCARMKPHQLSDKLGKIPSRSVGCWRIGLEASCSMKPWRGWNSTLTERPRLGGDPQLPHRSGPHEARRLPAHALSKVFADNIKLFSRITNTLGQEKIHARMAGAKCQAQTGRHLTNHVEPEVVEALQQRPSSPPTRASVPPATTS